MPTIGSKAIPFSRRLLLDEARRTRACRPHDRAKTALHGVCSEKSGEAARKRGAGEYAARWRLTEPPAGHSGQLPSLRHGFNFSRHSHTRPEERTGI
jgi:hypothetical protein